MKTREGRKNGIIANSINCYRADKRNLIKKRQERKVMKIVSQLIIIRQQKKINLTVMPEEDKSYSWRDI